VFVEPGLGWVSWWLYIVDDLNQRQGYDFPAISELPSHYYRQNVFLTFIDEPNAVRQAHESLGIENIMWSSDYPHPVSSWPHSRTMVEKMFDGVDPRERELIVSGNAARVWNL
jgi:predicted TIM-barrel fold metal-dependent hydrolase